MDNKRKSTVSLIISAVSLLLFIALTCALAVFDLRPIGPEGSTIGLGGINGWMLEIQKAVPERIQNIFYVVSEFVGIVSLFVMLAFAVYGVAQLISRRSLKKIDLNLYFLAALYAVMLALYVLFEIVVINCRPILVDGALEASYPSSHTVLTVCVMVSAAFLLWGKIKNPACRARS